MFAWFKFVFPDFVSLSIFRRGLPCIYTAALQPKGVFSVYAKGQMMGSK